MRGEQQSSNRIEHLLPQSQPRQHLKLGFPLGSEVDFSGLDALLGNAELIDPQILNPGPSPLQTNGPDSNARQFLERALLLSANLQRAGRIPCFEPGEILNLTPPRVNGENWEAEVAIVAIKNLPVEVPQVALKVAVQALLTLSAEKKPPPARLEALFNQLEQIVEKFRNATPTGKSTRAVLFGAYRNHIPFSCLGPGIYQLGWGSKGLLLDRSSVDQDSRLGSFLSENKARAAVVLRAAGLPAPEHTLVFNETQARDAASRLSWPVVVKPADCDRGEGVTIDVSDMDQLCEAFKHAQPFSKNVLIEQQAQGMCHRILVANNQLIFAVRRDPKSVTGDGTSTLLQLIEKENTTQRNLAPWRRKLPLPWDAHAQALAHSQGVDANSIIAEGRKVFLRKIESTEWGGTSVNVTDTIHAENIALAFRAADLFRLKVCGIDLITTNIEKPWYETGAKILELNFAPLFTATERGEFQDKFMAAFFQDDGRIPIEVFEGSDDKTKRKAERAQQKRIKKGERCYLLSGNQVFAPNAQPYPLTAEHVQSAVHAMLMNKSVDSLVIHTDGPEGQKTIFN